MFYHLKSLFLEETKMKPETSMNYCSEKSMKINVDVPFCDDRFRI